MDGFGMAPKAPKAPWIMQLEGGESINQVALHNCPLIRPAIVIMAILVKPL